MSFTYTDSPNPHLRRGREILKKYPEVRKLMRPYPLSAFYIVALTCAQIYTGYLLNNASFFWILVLSYVFGAFLSHALFTQIHEATHDLVLKPRWANHLMGFICNIGQGFPTYSSFRIFHMDHHLYLNDYEKDADLAFHREAKWVGTSIFRKMIWFWFFGIIETIRPMKLKDAKLITPLAALNIAVILLTNACIFYFAGPYALLYIVLSTFFSVGFHPLGGRWIQEHYTFKKGQETFSYYGPINGISFNIGYHNEHHDLMKIPWAYLPQVKAMAPEYYEHLFYHTSLTKTFLTFIFNKNLNLYSRIVRRPTLAESN